MATVRSYMCVCRRVVERTDNVNGESWNANDIWVIASDYLYEQQDTLGAVSCAASGNARVFMSQSRSLFFTSIDSPLFLFSVLYILHSHRSKRRVSSCQCGSLSRWQRLMESGRVSCFFACAESTRKSIESDIACISDFTLIRHFILIKKYSSTEKKERRADKAEFLFYVFWNFVGRRCKSS